MGILLRILKLSEEAEEHPSVFINFLDVKPTDPELESYNKAEELLKRSENILEELKSYKGAADEIKNAMLNPKDEDIQNKAWEILQPNITKIKLLYDFIVEISEVFPPLLATLCKEMDGKDLLEVLQSHPATIKQCALLLEFSLKFDDLKINNPAIQNDFSYYRRTISVKRCATPDEDLVISRISSDKISFVFGKPNPCFSSLIESVKKECMPGGNNSACSNGPLSALGKISACLATIITVCRHMLHDPELSAQFKDQEAIMFVLRFMTQLITLFDNVDEHGAFSKNSGFDVKNCIKVIKESQSPDKSNLMNLIRYACKHVNDATTPQSLKDMINCD